MFEPVNIAEEDGQGLSSGEAVPANRYRRSSILVATALLAGCVIAFSAVRQPGLASTDTQSMESFYSAMKSLDIDLEHMDLEKTLNVSNMPKEKVDRLLALKKKLFNNPVADRQLKSATCALDITQGTYFLERAALAITAATASCKGGSPHVQAACAADISGVYASFAFVAQFISSAVSQCAVVPDIQADCARGVAGIVANAGRIAVTAATMAGTCSRGAAIDRPISDSVWQMTRRLQGEHAVHPTYDERGMEIATCTLDVPQAVTYLAIFGVAIDRAQRRCAKIDMENTWLDKVTGRVQRGQVRCAADIFEILEALFMAASFVSSAISHCAPTTNQQALCASGAVGVVGGITGLTKNALLTDTGCKLPDLPVPPVPPPHHPRRRRAPPHHPRRRRAPPGKCPPKPVGCPASWANPPDFEPCCPADGICRGIGTVCICTGGQPLQKCDHGATCYSTGTIDTCDSDAECCATKSIDTCMDGSDCTAPRIDTCAGATCNTQGWN